MVPRVSTFRLCSALPALGLVGVQALACSGPVQPEDRTWLEVQGSHCFDSMSACRIATTQLVVCAGTESATNSGMETVCPAATVSSRRQVFVFVVLPLRSW